MRLALLLAVLGAAAQAPADGQAGTLVDGFACLSDPTETYAVFLPSTYTRDRTWPLVFVFDPRGRGAMAGAIFQDAAERYGWIVASSNNTRSDGPWEPNQRAIEAMFPDVLRRFAVDRRRIYAAGFSGGGGVAWALARDSGRLAGIITTGSPEPGRESAKALGAAWFGAAGRRDFNFLHAKAVYERLGGEGTPRRFEVFDGAHEWFPSSMAVRALGWLEALAMKDGRAAADADRLAAILAADRAEAEALAAGGRVSDAHRLYSASIAALDGSIDVAAEIAARAALEASPAFVQQSKDEARAERDERTRLGAIGSALTALYAPDLPTLPALRGALKIPQLQRQAAGTGASAEAAARSLEVIYVQTSYYLPLDLDRKGLAAAAAVSRRIAELIAAGRR